jgi:hypothetical protein
MKPRFTLTISVNVALCLFGIAAIIKALMHQQKRGRPQAASVSLLVLRRRQKRSLNPP